MRVSMGLAYPLDAETVAATEAAMTNYVEQCELVAEDIEEWVQESIDDDGKDEVSDSQFEAQCTDLRNAVQELIDAGEVEEGMAVHLEMVPNPFLRDVPLVEGEWIDRYVVELAEVGARMKARGFVLHEADDDHPLAWDLFAPTGEGGEWSEGTSEMAARVREQVCGHLSKFPGPVRDTGGRSYLSFEDYCRWRGRKVKGKLKRSVSKGIVISSWNEWVESHGGEGKAVLGGVRVGKLECHAKGSPYQVCVDADELARRLKERAVVLDGLRRGDGSSLWGRSQEVERVRQWKAMAKSFLVELYSARQAIDVISKRYFDGCEVLFPDAAEHLRDILGTMEGMVEMFNDGPAWNLEHYERMAMAEGFRSMDGESEQPGLPGYKVELEEFKAASQVRASDLAAYLVDMAKAEALDHMGDHRASIEVMERHL